MSECVCVCVHMWVCVQIRPLLMLEAAGWGWDRICTLAANMALLNRCGMGRALVALFFTMKYACSCHQTWPGPSL